MHVMINLGNAIALYELYKQIKQFNYPESMLTGDYKCPIEIGQRITMVKKNRTHFFKRFVYCNMVVKHRPSLNKTRRN